jgi:plastocyanin
MVRGALAGASVCLFATVAAAQPPAGGTIAGQVVLTSRVRGTALPSNVYQPRAVHSHEAAAIPEIRNVVVYLKNAVFRGALPVSRHTIRQKGEAFHPRVLAVTRGSTVEFPNDDPFFHNVFSLSSASNFDLGRFPMGRSKATTFAKPGLVKVYCHLHSHMSATILVLDHPYFTIPGVDGTFELADVAPGTYTIVGWHERVGERAETVDVRAGKSADIALSLPVEAAK